MNIGYMFVAAFILESCQICNGQNIDFVLRYYLRSLQDDYSTSVNDPLKLISFPGFDLGKKTVFYIHGYLEDPTWESIRTVFSAYFERGDHNTVLVDWSNLNTRPFLFNAGPNTYRVARSLGHAITTLVESGMNPSRIHIIGHSLGGQAAGFAGKALTFKINRITVLDAGNPGFYGLGLHVKETDAEFVDAIHTDSGIYGAPIPTATVDFWPNGGIRTQPGCIAYIPLLPYPLSDIDACSHWRSWRYWAESLRNEKAFPARKCRLNYYSRGQNRVEYLENGTETVYMGYAASNKLTGNYCLMTRSTSPFGLGNSNSNL